MPQTRAKTYQSKLFHTQLVRDILIKSMTEMQIKREYKLHLKEGGKRGGAPQFITFKVFKKIWMEKKEKKEQDEIQKITKKKVNKVQDAASSDNQQENELDDDAQIVYGNPEDLSDTERDVDGHEVEGSSQYKRKTIKTLDEVKAELRAKVEFQKNLKQLMSTSYEELHKHGYKPFVRWGVLKETLSAACILESGIIQKANKTGKLYLWDPFCGSGSFLIETLMMLLQQPVRNFDTSLPFQYWPVHQKESYEQFKSDLNDYQKMVRKNDIDIQIIGSDISQKAIETSIKNCEYSEIDKLIEEGLVLPRNKRFINNPLIFSKQYPSRHIMKNINENSSEESAQTQIINFKQTERDSLLSLYHGDFQGIGNQLALIMIFRKDSEIKDQSPVYPPYLLILMVSNDQLAQLTDNFKDFNILTNVPYGEQSKLNQMHSDTDLQNLYRRFGKFIRGFPALEKNTFVLAQSHHYGHKLSFEKFSNCGWSKEIAFNNGGIGVHLLKFDMSQVSEVKQTVEAYIEIAATP